MGPCLCGDPYCGSCGDPGLLYIEEAEERLMETLRKAKLSPEEYQIVLSVGLAAVHHARKAAQRTATIIAENQAEIEATKDYERMGEFM